MAVKWKAPALVAAGVVGLVFLVLVVLGDTPAPEAGGADVPVNDGKTVADLLADGTLVKGPKAVAHRERANGVDARLLAFLDDWEREGPFLICVCSDGGVRIDEASQEKFYAAGNSNAASLSETPHGRGGALDVAPYYRNGPLGNPPLLYDAQYTHKACFDAIGAFAQARGLVWGGGFGGNFVDMPHVEVPDWRSLPFNAPAPAASPATDPADAGYDPTLEVS